MTKNRWILPDGIEEVLPGDAWKLEQLRRQLLDQMHEAGYELVIPPLVEFADSLLTGLGEDLDLQTFKMVDQISGKTLGLRSDISPQVARIDAHSLGGEGVRRLCYAGSTLKTLPVGVDGSRAPIQVGAEIFGEADESADLEILGMMLSCLQRAGVSDLTLEVSHVGPSDALVQELARCGCDVVSLQEVLDSKSLPDIERWIEAYECPGNLADLLRKLPLLAGDPSVLDEGAQLLRQLPGAVDAIDQLRRVLSVLRQTSPDLPVFVDLCALRGSHYHSGLIFAAFAAGMGSSIANGGRYDEVGAAFGKARPATGFSADLRQLVRAISS